MTESTTGFTHYALDINPPYAQSARGKGIQASNDNRCPCCDSPRWCFILDDGNAVICERTDVAPDGWECTGTAKDQRPIYAKVGTSRGYQRYKGILPSPGSIILKAHPLADFPPCVEVGSDYRGVRELKIDFLYPDPKTGQPIGKVVRRQWSDRRRAYNDGKDNKHLRPWHWVEPYHPDQGTQGWWSDRGKGSKPWPLYREAEAANAIARSECLIVFNGTGEQAVETFRKLGLFSICAQGGEGTGDAQVIDFLKRNTPQVFVLSPDEDAAGHKAAGKLQEGCNRVKLPAVTISLKNVWAGLPPKGDITNIVTSSGMSDSEIVKRLEAEIRRAIANRLEHDRKLNDPDERLKLELQALLNESDPVKRMRLRAELASYYRLNKAEIEEALQVLQRRNTTPQPTFFSLGDFLTQSEEALDYIVPSMLPIGETVLLVAVPKAGKTLLATDLAFAVATGESDFLGEKCKRGRVLIVSVDESASSTRSKLIKRGFRPEDSEWVQVMTRFDISQMSALEERLELFRPSVVIIDSLRRINHGQNVSENSAEFADTIYTLKETLTRYNAAGVLIHHTNKDREATGVNRVRGSSAITGAVWGVWQLDHILKPDPNNKKRLIVDPKDPNRTFSVFARDALGQSLKVELDPENNHWISHGEGNEQSAAESMTMRQRIKSVLEINNHREGLTVSELRELLGLDPGDRSIHTILNRMVDKRELWVHQSTTDRRRLIYSLPKSGGDSPPPTPSQSAVEYCAENLTQQDLQTTQQIVNTYSKLTQHPSGDEPVLSNSNLDSVSDSEIVNTREQLGGGEGVGGDSLPIPLPADGEYSAEHLTQQDLHLTQQPVNTDSTLAQQPGVALVLNNSNNGSVSGSEIVNTTEQLEGGEGVIASTPRFTLTQAFKADEPVQYTGVKFQQLYQDLPLTIHSVDTVWSVASCRTPDGRLTTWLPFADLRRLSS